jgi:AcrR family transcriptional regulator
MNTTGKVAAPKRRSRTKAALTEATMRLLTKNTASGFAIDDVVREADVARGSFYNHFTSFDELILHTLTTVRQDLHSRIASLAIDSPDAAVTLARGIATVIHYGYENKAGARALMYAGPGVANPDKPSNSILTQTLKQGAETNVFRLPSMDAAVVSVLGICELGLSRMLDIHHEYSQVCKLAQGLCVAVLRCVGVDNRRIERIANEAVLFAFDGSIKS